MHKWHALQAREDALTDGFAVGRTALGRVYDIVRIKHEMESAGQKSSAANIAAHLFSQFESVQAQRAHGCRYN